MGEGCSGGVQAKGERSEKNGLLCTEGNPGYVWLTSLDHIDQCTGSTLAEVKLAEAETELKGDTHRAGASEWIAQGIAIERAQ